MVTLLGDIRRHVEAAIVVRLLCIELQLLYLALQMSQSLSLLKTSLFDHHDVLAVARFLVETQGRLQDLLAARRVVAHLERRRGSYRREGMLLPSLEQGSHRAGSLTATGDGGLTHRRVAITMPDVTARTPKSSLGVMASP